MGFEGTRSLVRSLPEVAAWPEMLGMIDGVGHRDAVSVWEYPAAACLALGGAPDASLPGEAAVFCSLISIHLVDDLLDHDPKGIHHRIGEGNAANMALAFQALAHRVLEGAPVAEPVRLALQAHVADMSLATAIGQSLDATEVADEAGYWRVVEAKTPPLFSSALAIGARLAGCSPATLSGLEAFGRQIALFIQVSDDLSDSLKTPAGADWRRPNNNLALLFAQHVDPGCRELFVKLGEEGSDPALLESAQTLLLSSGAVSYCVFKMIELWQSAKRSLKEAELTDPAPLQRLLLANLEPVERLFAMLGDELPDEFRTMEI
jgi:geranylgeranyl pyrophosphate synthase